MPADDELGEQFETLYHGTGADLQPGDLITGNRPSNLTGRVRPHVYATSAPGWARVYAQFAGNGPRKYGGNPRIYEVEPTGPIENDPTLGGKGAVRSLHPMRVIREHDVESFPERPEDD